MSKAIIKKVLTAMSKEDIVLMVLEMYDARKEAKEYLEYYASPNEDAKLEEYKKIIRDEFYPTKKTAEPKTRFSVCRTAVSDFKKLKPANEKLADLMLYVAENGCQFTHDYGDMWEQYYTAVENNFNASLKFIAKSDFFPQFKSRIMQCLAWAEDCGWGFPDTLWDIYYDYAYDYGWEEPEE